MKIRAVTATSWSVGASVGRWYGSARPGDGLPPAEAIPQEIIDELVGPTRRTDAVDARWAAMPPEERAARQAARLRGLGPGLLRIEVGQGPAGSRPRRGGSGGMCGSSRVGPSLRTWPTCLPTGHSKDALRRGAKQGREIAVLLTQPNRPICGLEQDRHPVRGSFSAPGYAHSLGKRGRVRPMTARRPFHVAALQGSLRSGSPESRRPY